MAFNWTLVIQYQKANRFKMFPIRFYLTDELR
jgi:hypothetical protein